MDSSSLILVSYSWLPIYIELLLLVMPLVPSLISYLACSPGKRGLEDVWISGSPVRWWLTSCCNEQDKLTKLFILLIALMDTPVFGWTSALGLSIFRLHTTPFSSSLPSRPSVVTFSFCRATRQNSDYLCRSSPRPSKYLLSMKKADVGQSTHQCEHARCLLSSSLSCQGISVTYIIHTTGALTARALRFPQASDVAMVIPVLPPYYSELLKLHYTRSHIMTVTKTWLKQPPTGNHHICGERRHEEVIWWQSDSSYGLLMGYVMLRAIRAYRTVLIYL